MAPFDELQTLWQSQPAPATPAINPAAIASAFRRYGRRQDIINGAKVVLIAVAFVITINATRNRPASLFASTLILATATLALIAEWRNQRAIARLDFSAPSVDFVRHAIARLQAQRNPFHSREYLILFAACFVGYNLRIVTDWYKMTVGQRVAAHAVASILPVLIYAFGRWLRPKRWNAECGPLVERLTRLRETLEERAQ